MSTRHRPPAADVPELAGIVFGSRLLLARRYVEWLSGAGVERGLVGPRETQRLWDRHILNSVGVAALTPSSARVVDIGSGAGLPGIVLAIARPDLHVVLVESMQRRTVFLDEVVADLRLANVEVRRARAEELRSPAIVADVVTARAVAPLDRLAGWAGPMLRPGGQLLALKGDRVQQELGEAWPALRRSGFEGRAELVSVRAGAADPSAGVVPGVPAGLVVQTERVVVAGEAFSALEGIDASESNADARLGLIVRLLMRTDVRPPGRRSGLR